MGVIDQLRAFSENVRAGLIRVKPANFLPPSLGDLGNYIFNTVSYAFGLDGSPYQQIYSSIALAILAFLTGFVSGGLAWFFIGIFVLTALWGVLRLFPAVDDAWGMIRDPFRRLYDRLVQLVWGWDI